MKRRVIGGSLKGKPLAAPKGLAVRPTAGRVREAIFNIILPRMNGAVVLDLFAGSGALGIEAISRGAARAVFVDNSPTALDIIKQNLQVCGLEDVAEALRLDATRNLTGLSVLDLMFDIVFMDPPYNKAIIHNALETLAVSAVLKNKSLLVLEHSPRESIDDDMGPFTLLDRRKYGRTVVTFLEYMIN